MMRLAHEPSSARARRAASATVLGCLALVGWSASVARAQDAGVDARSQEGSDARHATDAAGGDDVAGNDSDRARVLVLLLPTGELDPTVANDLSELLISAVATRGEGVRIVGKDELQAQLTQSDAETLECIGSMACLSRVGVQLGVGEVIAGTLARREPRWVFNLNRVDVPRGEIVGRIFREVEGDLGTVADALSAAIPELYEVPVRPAVLVIAGAIRGAEVMVDGVVVGTLDGELRDDDVAPGQHTVRVSAPGHAAWQREVQLASGAEVHLEAQLVPIASDEIHPVAWIAGAVALAAIAAAIPLAALSQAQLAASEEERRSMELTRAELLAFYAAREREAIAADVLFGIAGVAAIASVVGFFFPIHRGESTMSLRPTLGGVVVGGRFP